MTIQQTKKDLPESRFKEMEVENELLLSQIHQLEEELEHYFKRNQELEKGDIAGSPKNEIGGVRWVDDELPEVLAENQRLHALVDVLRKAHQLEIQNSLNVKLGNILIQGAESPGKLLAIPGKLGKIWRESIRKRPPHALGGKGFDKVIAAYSDGGFEAVEKLLSVVSLASAMQANAYTVLGRHLMKSDRAATAEAARYAYKLDPQPYRLKWLAFRLHEAGDIIEAEAMLDVLPMDSKFSESEARQASQLRNEAKHVRQHEAKQSSGFLERRVEFERRLDSLDRLSRERKEETELLLIQLHQAQEELESQYLKCKTIEEEKMVLTAQKEEQARVVADQQELIEQLKEALSKLDNEKSALADQKDEQTKKAAERLSKINELQQQIKDKQDSNADLLSRQQMMYEEMVRAEAQLDLIKDVLLVDVRL